ncbi:MAG: pyridoxamine 5'-phosphate oxidase family protein [Alphaproteobacteria bacterium]|nr:pyridoxamine 5'-phosphate oxidase family protein [Alphaproteobacteria bacterium]
MTDAQPTRAQRRLSRRLIRAANRAALGTFMPGDGEGERGLPYVSLVAVASDHDGSPILLLSTLADHTRNIAADPHVSLLFMDGPIQANPQQDPRVTLMGKAVRTEEPRHRARFLARHPGAALYADFADFGFFRVAIEKAHFVGGFARAAWINSILVASEGAKAMAEAEAGLLERMNGEHSGELAACAAGVLDDGEVMWRAVALDVDGLDVRGHREGAEDRVFRIAFDPPLADPASAIPTLVELAERRRK